MLVASYLGHSSQKSAVSSLFEDPTYAWNGSNLAKPPFISNDISSVDAMTNIENHPISIVQVVRYQKINTKN